MRSKLLDLQNVLDEELKKAEKSAFETRRSANEVSGGMAASYSVAGDAEHANNSALLSQGKLTQLKKLQEEIENSLNKDISEEVESPCFISVKFQDGSQKDFYLVNNPVYLSGLNLISPDSPIGKAMLGKTKGLTFSYELNNQVFSGEILDIL